MEKKTVWITGASSGLGEAMAREFNKMGTRVILSARRVEELERVRDLCEDAEDRVRILPLDVARPETFGEKVEEAVGFYGSVDMLVNNAGISQRALAVDATMDTVRKLMEVNFFGTVGLTKELLPHMIEKKSGHIVVISSVMGKIGTKYRSAYAASKHALQGWFDCLRQEMYEHNIDVTVVCPGYVKTDVTYNALTATGEKLNEMGDAHEKAMTPEEFAEQLIPKLAKRKEEITIGGFEILAVYLKRLSPVLLNKILKRSKVT